MVTARDSRPDSITLRPLRKLGDRHRLIAARHGIEKLAVWQPRHSQGGAIGE